MIITTGVKAGIGKQICDDIAIIDDRIISEDFFACETDSIRFVGIADGVGGNAGGKEASSFVASKLMKINIQGDADDLKRRIIELNDELIDYAKSSQGLQNMATTLTVLVFSNEKCFLVHVGNTRMYVGQGAYLKQFTTDHTTYQWLLTHGQIEAAKVSNKNEISACMGGGDGRLIQQIEVRQIFEEGMPNCVIFTSDGIHEYVDIDGLESMIFEKIPDEDIIGEVMTKAEKNGSRDDKTLIILRK